MVIYRKTFKELTQDGQSRRGQTVTDNMRNGYMSETVSQGHLQNEAFMNMSEG